MKVLLARPHDFVVADMTRWMNSLGAEPVRLQGALDLSPFAAGEVGGVVISTAVTSMVSSAFGEVLDATRAAFPRAPVIIAGLTSTDSARSGFAAELKRNGLTLFGHAEHAPWGAPTTALYVTGRELQPPRSEALDAVARKHLRLG
jgi:hypothetical protein